MSSRPALGSIQPPIQWSPGVIFRGYSGRGLKLTTHLQLVSRSRKCGSIHSLLHAPPWRTAYLVKYRSNFTLPFLKITSLLSWSVISRDSSVGIATGYGLDDRHSILCRNKRFFFRSQRPDWLGSAISLQEINAWGSFPCGKPAGVVKLTTVLHLVSNLIRANLFLHSPQVFMALCLIS
jgi:hypothetical protein